MLRLDKMTHPGPKGSTLTTAEAAALLEVSVATLKRWAQSGLLPSERTEGGHRRFRLEDVQALASPPAQRDDPVRRGADLVAAAGDALGLQGWLLQARRDLGSWWVVAQPLRAVVAELYRRRSCGALGAVRLEVALDRLRAALVRLAEAMACPPGAPTLLLAAVPGDPFLVAPAVLQLAALESGWQADWAGRPEAADLEEELRRRPVRAVVLCASLGAPRQDLPEHLEAISRVSQAEGIPVALLGMGDWPERPGPIRAFPAVADLQAWLETLLAGPPAGEAPPPAAPDAGLRWDTSLALGHAVVDAQHRTLFTQVSAFLALVARGEADPELGQLLGFIADYAQIHFRYEEHLMRTTGFPGLAGHVLEHEGLLRRLEGLANSLGPAPTAADLRPLAAFLRGWLLDHVGGSDQRIGEHLRRAAPPAG